MFELSPDGTPEFSGTFRWSYVPVFTDWEVKFGPEGFDPTLEGSTVPASSVQEGYGNQGFYNLLLPSLTPNTDYDITIKPDCGESQRDWDTINTSIRVQPEIIFRYVSEQGGISGEFGETTTPSFGLVDIKISYRIAQIMANVGVNNLLDENYYEHLNRSVRGSNTPILAPGRNWFVNVNYTI